MNAEMNLPIILSRIVGKQSKKIAPEFDIKVSSYDQEVAVETINTLQDRSLVEKEWRFELNGILSWFSVRKYPADKNGNHPRVVANSFIRTGHKFIQYSRDESTHDKHS